MTHPKINSVAEPWLLLPFLSTIKEEGILAKYSHGICNNAFNNFIKNSGGKDNYLNNLNNFAKNLYNSASDDKHIYFLDKTPRYHLIIPEIAETFPEAKFIFLFRHPLSIYSSVLRTWNKNRFFNHGHYVDLYEGPDNLLKGYNILKEKSLKINYEDLVIDLEKQVNSISKYLNLKSEEFNIEEYNSKDLKGRMGDQKGIKKYSSVSNKSINKWEKTFNTNFRKKIAKKYITELEEDYLELTGFKKKSIIKEINDIKSDGLGIVDFIQYGVSNIYREVKVKIQVQSGKKLFTKNKEKSLYT
jgi:c-di-AMP phosphodiesterase-like protein